MGGLPLVGTPDQMTGKLLELSGTGVNGTLISLVDYNAELPYWNEKVTPLLEQAGLQQACEQGRRRRLTRCHPSSGRPPGGEAPRRSTRGHGAIADKSDLPKRMGMAARPRWSPRSTRLRTRSGVSYARQWRTCRGGAVAHMAP
jgi:hypothetical protein